MIYTAISVLCGLALVGCGWWIRSTYVVDPVEILRRSLREWEKGHE